MRSRLRRKCGVWAHRIARSVDRHRDSPVVGPLLRVSRSFLAAVDNTRSPYDFETNGEGLLIERLCPHIDVVFDVGANVGDWSALALRHGATCIHAFEISPSTAESVVDRFADDHRVTVNAIGLGADQTELLIHHYPDHNYLTSTSTKFSHDHPYIELTVPVQRGDDYATAAGIERIDLLKIDVEGAEPQVLQGFTDYLSAGRIGAIQFEYGVVAMVERFIVADYYDLLVRNGYELGGLTSEGVHFVDYNLNLERFQFVNWVAVHQSRPDLKQRLAIP